MIIGITGTIASGKSTVSDYFIKQGYEVIDADKITKELQQKKKYSKNFEKYLEKKYCWKIKL
ncbi:hypothetical protein C095_08080 [Fusobacterium necrophorum subsp. funduliforme B35]|uniref:Dephospho-CoA kinase n=1 Tax=Fusobacterium necrophorum subsp. funduliforme B35 TaxID=1226633 RepID=A0A0B4EH88_9FUSO|nr:hypothetical protein C095_08080 [Fusobacterium necrophorum subsp. funduliforme B35]